MQSNLNYTNHNNSYHATFNKNILNIYNSQDILLTSKAYSDIIYIQQAEELFKSSVDIIDNPIQVLTD